MACFLSGPVSGGCAAEGGSYYSSRMLVADSVREVAGEAQLEAQGFLLGSSSARARRSMMSMTDSAFVGGGVTACEAFREYRVPHSRALAV